MRTWEMVLRTRLDLWVWRLRLYAYRRWGVKSGLLGVLLGALEGGEHERENG